MEEMQDFQRELWEVSEARETFRLEQEAQWEQELLEMVPPPPPPPPPSPLCRCLW